MVGAAHSPESIGSHDFDYGGGQIVLTPEVVDARIKKLWQRSLIAATLLGPAEDKPQPTIQKITEAGFTGEVDWLSEKGGYNRTDMKWTKVPYVVRPYGVEFDIFADEVKFGQRSTISRRIEYNTYMMAKFQDTIIYTDMQASAIAGGYTDEASDWSDPTTGTPIKDLQDAKRAISRATQGAVKPNYVVMSELTFGYLTQFDLIKNRLYNTQGPDGYVVTGTVPTILGMTIIQDDQVDPTDAGLLMTGRSGSMTGYLARVEPFQTFYAEGRPAMMPELQWRYWMKARQEPVIEGPECLYVLTGVHGEA